jgi:3-deoxy-manno-octulosonate cytidylyltransferase (CMP-KDO synthetase)
MAGNCVIIPARFDSTRFPGKLLKEINSKSLLQHVYTNAMKSSLVSKVLIATDSKLISEHCEEKKMDFMMTRSDHISGTDRVAEAAGYLKSSFETIINLQGDEPMVTAKEIDTLIHLISAKKTGISTLYAHKMGFPTNPNEVKLVTNKHSKVLYFSRSPLPYSRDHKEAYSYKHHIGMYGFRPKVLQELSQLGEGLLEKQERLEQLRWMEHGYEIFASETDYVGFGIDTPEDLKKAREVMGNN